MKKKKLTVGHRAKFLLPNDKTHEDSWCMDYGGREVLLL